MLAMPKQAEAGLPLRAKQYRIAWDRIERAFPKLETRKMRVTTADNSGYMALLHSPKLAANFINTRNIK